MKIIWITDIHLNFLVEQDIETFCASIMALHPQMVLIGGDIAEAPTIKQYLQILDDNLRCPVYFVLGNHDFYKGSVSRIRNEVGLFAQSSTWLNYLPISGIVELNPDTCLMGQDGWSDGRYGNFLTSTFMLNDYVLIEELSQLDKPTLLATLNALGDEAAALFDQQLTEALSKYRHVYALTHVPPFIEACWHEGNNADDNAAPHFSCKAVGDVMLAQMKKHPDRALTVLCGHTHSGGYCQKLPNLQVLTGAAEYYRPQIQNPIFIA